MTNRKTTKRQVLIVMTIPSGRNGNRYATPAKRLVKNAISARIKETSAQNIPLWSPSVPSSEPPPMKIFQKLFVSGPGWERA